MAMGMEVEIHRRITNAAGDTLDGDTPLFWHCWFNLVSDKIAPGGGAAFSNMEFVLGHFDQKTVAPAVALTKLTRRVQEMRSIWTQLYAQTGRLGTVVPREQPDHALTYHDDPEHGRTEGLLVGPSLAADDQLLYVHYTVGFAPLQWRDMLRGVAAVARPDNAASRARTHVLNGLAVASAIVESLDEAVRGSMPVAAATELVREELIGHLALVYMHAGVFIDRTLTLHLESLRRRAVRQARIAAVAQQLGFESGQPKNKIAALPRADLAQLFGVLSQASREVLSENIDVILDGLARKFEETHQLDFPEGFELESPEDGSATLGEFVRAGLDGADRISQQVLFGGMNLVGVDDSVPSHPMIPFEFRSIYAGRVSWAQLLIDATKILNWSRDPRQILA
ncbi:hypothetical protein AB0I28_29505 [Phytomonospora sp. NPDC050363]|uniref:hypothetical protein n=1 Tax=Phytomonospora sp. NPDC050363 TaxID=3155642 RepID=UPI0033EAA8F8